MIKEFTINTVVGGNMVLYFTASWVNTCVQTEAMLTNASKMFPNISFLKVNTTKLPKVKQEFGVTGIPCFIFVKNGVVFKRLAGGISEKVLISILSNY